MSSFTVSAGLATYTGFRAVPQVRLSPPRVSAAARCNWPLIFSGFEGFGSATRRSGRLDVGDEASRDALDRRIRVRGWFDPRRRFAGARGDDPRSRASSRPRSARGAPLVTSIARRARVPRADSPHPTPPEQKASAKAAVLPRVGGRSARLNVQANKRVSKKANVVLTESVDKLGNAGDLVEVSLGFFRNHLEPMGKAKKATAEILAEVEANAAAEVAAKNAESAGAKAIATALKTIGKFVVKKTVGEDGKIFGSVTAAEVADAVEQQTGKALDKKAITVPDISEVGTYDVTVKLHPEVTGEFKLEVQKA